MSHSTLVAQALMFSKCPPKRTTALGWDWLSQVIILLLVVQPVINSV